MFSSVFGFEWAYRLRQPIFHIFAALFFFMTFMATSSDSVQIGGGIGNVDRNSPFIIVQTMGVIGFVGLIVITILMAGAVARDRELGMSEILFSTPLRKLPFLLGRFSASLAIVALCTCAGALGIALAAAMPWQDASQIQPFSLTPYLYALLVFVLPNLFLSACIFFSISLLSGRAIYTYVGMIAFFALWGFSQSFLGDLESETLAVLADPFGLTALNLSTRYWTIIERNSELPTLVGPLLANRIIWMSVGALLLAFTCRRFRMALDVRKHGSEGVINDDGSASDEQCRELPIVAQDLGRGSSRRQWLALTRAETRAVLRSLPFLILLLFGVFNLLGNLSADVDGTNNYPVTGIMLRRIAGGYDLFTLIVIVLFSAEMVWRERKARMHEITGALPVSGGTFLAAKFAALLCVVLVAQTAALLCAMGYQIVGAYFRFEPLLYFKGLYVISFLDWLLLAALAIFTQVITRQRYIGFLLMLIYFLAITFLPEMGLKHHLYLFRTTPAYIHSDMNGYGHFAQGIFHFNLYWLFLAAAMLILAGLLWPRGGELALRPAFRGLRRSWRPRHGLTLTACLLGFILSGAFIYYNTNVLNEYVGKDGEEKLAALYEQRYKQYESLPRPKICSVRIEADIFPAERKVDLRGRYHLRNKSDAPIADLHLTLPEQPELISLSVSGEAHALGKASVRDDELGYRIIPLATPLPPGAEMDLEFTLLVDLNGFVNDHANAEIVANGTFFNNMSYLPRIGYLGDRELQTPSERRKHGLPEDWRMPTRDDAHALGIGFTPDGDWIDYEAIISTSPDQIVLTPGYLQDEWIEDGRRYFHYKSEQATANFFAILSGRYEIHRDSWGEVAIEIYHHPGHDWNCGRMVEAVQEGLDYFTANFGPYPHRQFRVIEFPRYRHFAQSFPNTIPFSESASFINDLRDENNIDMVFYILAHELAHQWWGHQVMPASVRGGQMIAESLAQYSALMVMEKNYGRDDMRRFLAYELHRYLRGRGRERDKELPLLDVENESYIYYMKGSLVFYALRDYIGEEALNSALRELVAEYAFREPPYATSQHLLEKLRAVTPPKYAYLLEDMFETITLYDNRSKEAVCEALPDGRYKLSLSYVSRKYRADGEGRETELAHEDWIEVGAFARDEAGKEYPLLLEKRRVVSGEGVIEMILDERPERAGIDPRNLLIDRVIDDNCRSVSG